MLFPNKINTFLYFKTPSTNVADIIETVDTYLIKSIIPKRMIGVQCSFNGTDFNQVEYEDLVLPNRQTSYRIHPFYLRDQSMIEVQVCKSLLSYLSARVFAHTLPR